MDCACCFRRPVTQPELVSLIEQLHYGVCVADLNGDGQDELFVCGFGNENRLLKVSKTPSRRVLSILNFTSKALERHLR